MPRQPRIQYPGALYHVMSRGDRRENIFLDDVDRQDFLKTLAETCRKTAFQVHAYCLMSNHFRLLERMEGELGAHHSGELGQERAEAKAERIIGEELSRLGWNES